VKANGERNLRSTDRLQCRVVIEKIEDSKWETLFLKPEPKKQQLLRATKSGKVLTEKVAELNRNEKQKAPSKLLNKIKQKSHSPKQECVKTKYGPSTQPKETAKKPSTSKGKTLRPGRERKAPVGGYTGLIKRKKNLVT